MFFFLRVKFPFYFTDMRMCFNTAPIIEFKKLVILMA